MFVCACISVLSTTSTACCSHCSACPADLHHHRLILDSGGRSCRSRAATILLRVCSGAALTSCGYSGGLWGLDTEIISLTLFLFRQTRACLTAALGVPCAVHGQSEVRGVAGATPLVAP